MIKLKVSASLDNLPQVQDFIRDNLKKNNAKAESITKTLLLSEELYVALCGAVDDDRQITVTVNRKNVNLQGKGSKVELNAPQELCKGLEENEMDEVAEARIRSMILNAYSDILSSTYRNGVNNIKIVAKNTSGSNMKRVLMPVIIFVSIVSLIYTSDLTTVVRVVEILVIVIVTDILMLAAYGLLVFILGRKNPLTFYKNVFPAWLNAFALASSNAAMTYTMKTCDEKLKINQSLYSFSIPLGATINMDGLSITLSVLTLFFAKAFSSSRFFVRSKSEVFTRKSISPA